MMRSMVLSIGLTAVLASADNSDFSPLINVNGTRGLTQTVSAEALGGGRVSFALSGSSFKQNQELGGGSVNKNLNLLVYQGAFAYGLNNSADLFGTIYFYDATATQKGVGSGTMGLKFSLPFPDDFPLRLGVQGKMIAGYSDEQLIVDHNGTYLRPDGYNYFETRTGYDFQALLLQSLILGSEDFIQVRLHGNEGVSASLQDSTQRLLLLAGGLELSPSRYVSLGVEANWRTVMSHRNASDPLWITPSLHLKSSTGFNIFGGADIKASSSRPDAPSALAPWRAFGGITFSFDIFAKDREAARRKAQKDSLELVKLRKDYKDLTEDKRRLGGDSLQLSKSLKQLADSLALRQKELNAKDSALAARLKELALKDSSLLLAEQARHRQMSRADSLEAKRLQDSLAMAKSLEEERAKRGAFERDLISKGVAKLEAVYFENGKTELSINSKPYLQMIASTLAKYPKLKLEVGGHTDSKGAKAANLKLSTGRAKSVRAFFVESYPELANSITFKGYGSTKPKASNATADGRLQNRRVEMKVLNPEVLKEYTTP